MKNSAFGLPLRRFRPPIQASVTVSRQNPIELRSVFVSGAIREVRGPYQLSGDWWDQHPWSVQEWDVELATGGLYRLSQEAETWKLAGVFA